MLKKTFKNIFFLFSFTLNSLVGHFTQSQNFSRDRHRFLSISFLKIMISLISFRKMTRRIWLDSNEMDFENQFHLSGDWQKRHTFNRRIGRWVWQSVEFEYKQNLISDEEHLPLFSFRPTDIRINKYTQKWTKLFNLLPKVFKILARFLGRIICIYKIKQTNENEQILIELM